MQGDVVIDEALRESLDRLMGTGSKDSKPYDPYSITRYEASDTMQESETGEMVRYADHLVIVENMKQRIRGAYQSGKESMIPSWRL